MADKRRTAGATPAQRKADRHPVNIPARLTWKDSSGAVRFVSVMTRDVSDLGVYVDCDGGAAIPLHRLVHLQIERTMRGNAAGLPMSLREGRVLSAVWRVAPCRKATGTPSGYALRFLLDPESAVLAPATTTERTGPIAVAS
ncbi:MAG: hypothetical protein ABI665_25775 [Vicinamibacterales bacterium]